MNTSIPIGYPAKKPAKKSRQYPEEAVQRACVQILRSAVPTPEDGGPLWWASTNQRGTRKGWEQGILTAMGMVNGVHDLLMLWRGRLITFEMKYGKNGLTDEQKLFRDRVILCGGVTFECRSVDEFIDFLHVLGVPCRARIGVGRVAR